MPSDGSFDPSVSYMGRSCKFYSSRPNFKGRVKCSQLAVFGVFPLPSVGEDLATRIPESVPVWFVVALGSRVLVLYSYAFLLVSCGSTLVFSAIFQGFFSFS